ncbi:hypothetical protein FB45DRAFT_1030537 [Roridomyces roridus]|uniref:Uncharacterized protein n=1 Tax=Roridomyces roridus TaxID=1738132 RepID=A0AAD7FH89_9AGAR|nr:hypothetical protein FB45DRAFT_1030537 [Roridomyces roridus]
MANDLTASYAGCQGVYQMFIDNPASAPSYPSANIALNCNGQIGNTIIAPFAFVVNGQQLSCVLLNKNDGSGSYYTICGPSAAAATTCAMNARQAVIGTYPQSTLSTPTYRFHP